MKEETEVGNIEIRLRAGVRDENLRRAHNVRLSVPNRVGKKGLRGILGHLLQTEKEERWEFSISDEALRTTLGKFLERRRITTEKTVDVTYYKAIAREGEREKGMRFGEDWLSCVEIWEGGVCVGGFDGMVTTSGREGEEEVRRRHGRVGVAVRDVEWMREGEGKLVSVGGDGRVCVWDRTNEKMMSELDCMTGRGLSSVAEGERGVMGVGGMDGSVWVVRVEGGGACHGRRLGMGGGDVAVADVVWRGDELLAGGWDGTVRVWDAEKGVAKRVAPVGKAVGCMTGAGVGVVAGGFDGRLRIVDGRDGRGVVGVCGDLSKHEGVVSGVCDMGETGVGSGGMDGGVKVWDLRAFQKAVVQVKDVHGEGGRSLDVAAVRREAPGEEEGGEHGWIVYSAGQNGMVEKVSTRD